MFIVQLASDAHIIYGWLHHIINEYTNIFFTEHVSCERSFNRMNVPMCWTGDDMDI